jgi:predicted transcriptional regulator
LDVVCRVLDILSENGPLKKTRLSVKAGLNYNSCVKYSTVLKRIGWTESRSFDGWEVLSLTALGLERRNLHLELDMRDLQKNSVSSSMNKNIGSIIYMELPFLPPMNKYDDNRPLTDLAYNPTSTLTGSKVLIVDEEKDVLYTTLGYLMLQVIVWIHSSSALNVLLIAAFMMPRSFLRRDVVIE